MHRRILKINPDLLAQFFKTGTGFVEVMANPLPADARIVDACLQFGLVSLIVESDSFSELRPGDELCVPSPRFKRTESVEAVSARFSVPVERLKEMHADAS